MSLISKSEYEATIEAARRFDCTTSRSSDSDWSGQFVFLGLGVIGVASWILQDGHVDSRSIALAFAVGFICLSLCFRANWKRKVALCTLQQVIEAAKDSNEHGTSESEELAPTQQVENPYKSPGGK